MTRSYSFQQVDVFTDRIFGGNPLAVFADGRGLSTNEMQAIALEMNLSETTFVLTPDEPSHFAKVRIFTPHAELPFAGHPTVGTAWALANSPEFDVDSDSIELELGVGPVTVDYENRDDPAATIWMNQGRASFGEVIEDREAVADSIGVDAGDLASDLPIQFASTGLPFLYIPLSSREAIDRASLTGAGIATDNVETSGAFLLHSEPGSNRVYSRMIATIGGAVWEDPATGSANGPLGAYIVEHGLSSGTSNPIEIVSEQGVQMGRPSTIRIRVAVDQGSPAEIQVGGTVVPVFDGVLRIPK